MQQPEHQTVTLPESYGYTGAFLTFRCNNSCSFCINKNPGSRVSEYTEIPGKKWIDFFKRISSSDVPVTLQGGEPGLHPDFCEIVAETLEYHHVDILTTLDFDLDKFATRISPEKINRPALYAPIRVSYHPAQNSLETIIDRVEFLVKAGFRVGIYGVLHPDQLDEIEEAKKICTARELDFRTKEFLGVYKGKVYGQYAYPDACYEKTMKTCECAPSELLIAPDGSIHRCHHHLYGKLEAVANVEDKTIVCREDFIPCRYFGKCNPCDVKTKTNRFQQYGHVSAKIRNITNS